MSPGIPFPPTCFTWRHSSFLAKPTRIRTIVSPAVQASRSSHAHTETLHSTVLNCGSRCTAVRYRTHTRRSSYGATNVFVLFRPGVRCKRVRIHAHARPNTRTCGQDDRRAGRSIESPAYDRYMCGSPASRTVPHATVRPKTAPNVKYMSWIQDIF